MSSEPAHFVVAEQGPVPITVDFLRRVHERLTGLAEALDRQEASARRLVRQARDDVGITGRNWRGPRSRKVVTSASTYLDAIVPYADAIVSARQTIRRWARAALETAEELARYEQMDAEPSVHVVTWCGVPESGSGRCGTPSDPIEELRDGWRQRSRRIGAELDAATTAIVKTNAAVVTNIAADQPFELRQQLGLQNLKGPDHVSEWWRRLTDGEQLALLTAYPGLLAGIDGLPPRARRQARRTQAGTELVRLETLAETGDLTPQQARRLREIRSELSALGFDDDRPDVTFVEATQPSTHFVAVNRPEAEFEAPSGHANGRL